MICLNNCLYGVVIFDLVVDFNCFDLVFQLSIWASNFWVWFPNCWRGFFQYARWSSLFFDMVSEILLIWNFNFLYGFLRLFKWFLIWLLLVILYMVFEFVIWLFSLLICLFVTFDMFILQFSMLVLVKNVCHGFLKCWYGVLYYRYGSSIFYMVVFSFDMVFLILHTVFWIVSADLSFFPVFVSKYGCLYCLYVLLYGVFFHVVVSVFFYCVSVIISIAGNYYECYYSYQADA